MTYENRVCCFIDILGFKEHLEATVDQNGNDNVEKIKEISSVLHFSQKITKNHGLSDSRRITYFSDSIVISYELDEPEQLFISLIDLLHLNLEMAYKGYLVRGGVSIGKLVHNENVIFGPALNEAYRIESKLARYPRIVIDRNVFSEGLSNLAPFYDLNADLNTLSNIINVDYDECIYIDYIEKSMSEIDDSEYGVLVYIDALKEYFINIENKHEDVQQKLEWLKEKVNLLINKLQSENYGEELNTLYAGIEPIK